MLEAIKARHSVRSYDDRQIEDDKLDVLVESIAYANHHGDLNLQLRVDEPAAFDGIMARYGQFRGVRNYIACIGRKSPDLDGRIGYFGEKVVLDAQSIGLNTCWVGLTYSKSKMGAKVLSGESCACVIALGYGTDQGKGHRVKDLETLCRVNGRKVERIGNLPDWFKSGLQAAQLAPTALNQQKFCFDLHSTDEGHIVKPMTSRGPYAQMDLGIACRHFSIGADVFSSDWSWG